VTKVHTVLVVADNEHFLHQLVRQLHPEGFESAVAGGVDDTLARLESCDPSVVVLDVALRNGEPRDICRRIRERSAVPVLVLSSDPTGEELMEYLDLGADDYLPRPDRLRELVARMRALLRRRPVVDDDGAEAASSALRVGDVALDAERHEVVIRGARVDLPLKQFQLLELLLSNAGHVLTRATILRRVWGTDSPTDSNTLEVQIKRLRHHVEDDPGNPSRIRTIRGLGYVYADERSRV
jgi:two-component system response regulator RegX3